MFHRKRTQILLACFIFLASFFLILKLDFPTKILPCGLDFTEIPDDLSLDLIFLGHTYLPPRQLALEENTKRQIESHIPLAILRKTDRVIFGGDTIFEPTNLYLAHLKTLQAKIPQSVFLPGNHERYFELVKTHPEIAKRFFPSRNRFEEVKGVGLFYIHTIAEDRRPRIDEDSLAFLRSKRGKNVRYSLLFLHNAFWATQKEGANLGFSENSPGRRRWMEEVLPTLKELKVLGVFAGDGGVYAPFAKKTISNIPHFVSGWNLRGVERDLEGLGINLEWTGPRVHRLLAKSEVFCSKKVSP